VSKPGLSISKSKFLLGLQCPKLLWVSYNDKKLLPPVGADTQAIFDQGHEVGLLAQKLFPGGVAVGGDISIDAVVAETHRLLQNRTTLFEAGFTFNRGFARLDVLEPNRDGSWNIIEVKSGTKVEEVHVIDVAFQRYCCEGAGLRIRRCTLLHIDNTYVLQGAVDPAGLFAAEDITAAVTARLPEMESRLKEMLRTIELRARPDVEIGPHCQSPYGCPLIPVCWEPVQRVASNVFTLTRISGKAWDLYGRGIIDTADIPADFKLTENQRIQQRVEHDTKPHVDKRAVTELLGRLRYPLFLLDFETFGAAVPRANGTRPYQQVPFQFSLHVVPSLDAAPEHHSWIWDGQGDPRKELLERLSVLLGESGSIVAYNAGFEMGRLTEAVAAHTTYKGWLAAIRERVVDLLVPFRSFDVYLPGQHGSASLKSVLPALTGRDYSSLDIQDGGQASRAFMEAIYGPASREDRARARQDLEAYCGQDTEAMLDIIRELTRMASG
jgi:hypothetical protein